MTRSIQLFRRVPARRQWWKISRPPDSPGTNSKMLQRLRSFLIVFVLGIFAHSCASTHPKGRTLDPPNAASARGLFKRVERWRYATPDEVPASIEDQLRRHFERVFP